MMHRKLIALPLLFAAAGAFAAPAATPMAAGTVKPAEPQSPMASGAMAMPGATAGPHKGPPQGAGEKKWKDCSYDSAGHVTNAPCTGTKRDDKGTTWWPA